MELKPCLFSKCLMTVDLDWWGKINTRLVCWMNFPLLCMIHDLCSLKIGRATWTLRNISRYFINVRSIDCGTFFLAKHFFLYVNLCFLPPKSSNPVFAIFVYTLSNYDHNNNDNNTNYKLYDPGVVISSLLY